MHYRGMDRAALDAAYNNTAAVGLAKRDAYVADRTARSDAFRRRHAGRIDVPYGAGARQRLDVFPSGRPGAPTLVFIHGGYWQLNDKEPYAFVGEAALPAGFNVVQVEYTLAPTARLDQIVAEVRSAVSWVIEHAKEFGGDLGRVFVSGSSAGGHLTAAAMTDARLAGGIAISGLYDLEPIRLSYLNQTLGLTMETARRNSPVHQVPAAAGPLLLPLGEKEGDEYHRQTEALAAAWRRRGGRAEVMDMAGHDHFSIVTELGAPGTPLVRAVLAQIAAVSGAAGRTAR